VGGGWGGGGGGGGGGKAYISRNRQGLMLEKKFKRGGQGM